MVYRGYRPGPNKNTAVKVAQAVALFVILVGLMLAGLFGADLAGAHHGGPAHPPGYGTKPCPTLAYDVYNALGFAVSIHELDRVDFILHSIGCDQNQNFYWVPAAVNRCDALAYRLALRRIEDGRISAFDVRTIRARVKARGCIQYEDGTYAPVA
jgi:hypothetical protein